MLRPLLPIAILTLGVTGSLIQAASPSPRPLGTIENIEWRTRGGDEPRLEIEHDGMHSTLDASDVPELEDLLSAASPSSPGEAVSFSLAREAGALACSGRKTGGAAHGTCRFDPSEAYVDALSARGLRPEDEDELLALALVDAQVAAVDDLSHNGIRIGEVGDLIAVAALDVTADYVAELRSAGLMVDDLDDLIAARALEIDAQWVEEMADAGFPNLTVERAIQMRALDVTPDYARRMRQVAAGMGELM